MLWIDAINFSSSSRKELLVPGAHCEFVKFFSQLGWTNKIAYISQRTFGIVPVIRKSRSVHFHRAESRTDFWSGSRTGREVPGHSVLSRSSLAISFTPVFCTRHLPAVLCFAQKADLTILDRALTTASTPRHAGVARYPVRSQPPFIIRRSTTRYPCIDNQRPRSWMFGQSFACPALNEEAPVEFRRR